MTQFQEPLAPADDRSDGPADGAPQGSRWAQAHHVLLYFLAGGLVIWLLTGFYKVEANEIAIVERLGQYVTIEPRGQAAAVEEYKAEKQSPGQHYGLPWPFDIVHRVPMQAQTVEVRDFYEASLEVKAVKQQILMRNEVAPALLDAIFDPYLITSDKNVVHAAATVQYQIENAEEYLRSMSHAGRDASRELEVGKAAIGRVALHAMIQEFAKTPVDEALYQGQQKLRDRILEAMQPDIVRLRLGVKVTNIVLVVRWPAQVDAAFRSVTEAAFGARAAEEEAKAYADRVLQQARLGEVAKLLSEAEGYRARTVQEARAEAARFTQLLQRYEEAPEVTKISLYTDAVNAVLSNVSRILYVPKGESATIILDPPEDKPKVGGGGARDGAGPGR